MTSFMRLLRRLWCALTTHRWLQIGYIVVCERCEERLDIREFLEEDDE